MNMFYFPFIWSSKWTGTCFSRTISDSSLCLDLQLNFLSSILLFLLFRLREQWLLRLNLRNQHQQCFFEERRRREQKVSVSPKAQFTNKSTPKSQKWDLKPGTSDSIETSECLIQKEKRSIKRTDIKTSVIFNLKHFIYSYMKHSNLYYELFK